MKNKDKFLQPPDSAPDLVMDRNTGDYVPLEQIAGTQPYYWYQGIGNITGIKPNYVTHNGDNVIHNGQKVTHQRV